MEIVKDEIKRKENSSFFACPSTLCNVGFFFFSDSWFPPQFWHPTIQQYIAHITQFDGSYKSILYIHSSAFPF